MPCHAMPCPGCHLCCYDCNPQNLNNPETINPNSKFGSLRADRPWGPQARAWNPRRAAGAIPVLSRVQNSELCTPNCLQAATSAALGASIVITHDEAAAAGAERRVADLRAALPRSSGVRALCEASEMAQHVKVKGAVGVGGVRGGVISTNVSILTEARQSNQDDKLSIFKLEPMTFIQTTDPPQKQRMAAAE
jgi:hypothetical protein